MIARPAPESSLRLDRPTIHRLAWAFALSLVLHLLCWGGYELGQRYQLWEKLRLPAWVEKLLSVIPPTGKPTQPREPPDTQPPLIFVEVNPSVAVAEAPKNAPYYSDKSAKAANPEADQETGIPRITGTQTQVPKTEDVERKPFNKLMPAFPPESEQPSEETRAKPTQTPGDLTMAKPDLNPRKDTGQAERAKPRTIKEALAQKQLSQIPGRKINQAGGVGRIGTPSFDVQATGFGAYDAAFITAVSQRWYDLLDSVSYDGYRQGKVVLQFNLNYDGRITEMKTLENTVPETLSLMCQKAILDPAPFEKWPREMRLAVGEDFRKITFTFYYN